MNWLCRWLRLRVLSAELRDLDRGVQRAKDYIANAYWERVGRLRELEELESSR